MRFNHGLPWTALLLAAALTGCATAKYHQSDREPIEPAGAVELGEWPDGIHIVCPAEPAPEARCPAGAEFVGYDLEAAGAIERFVTAAQANEEIAETQAEQIRALDAEAAAANETAAELEAELGLEDYKRLTERLGWIGALGLTIWLGL